MSNSTFDPAFDPAFDPKTTGLIHHAYVPPAGFAAPQPGVYKASTVIFASTAAMRARDWKSKHGYTYGLHGTPTTFMLEERIAALEGGLQTLLVPSGLAAITMCDMALLKAGDEVLIPDNAYGPGKELARVELAKWGITHRLYDPANPAALATMLTPATKLVWLEAPGSVTMEFPDIPALVRAARTSAGTSGNSIVTEPGASSHTSFVAGVSIVASAAGSAGSYRRWVIPHLASSTRASSFPGP